MTSLLRTAAGIIQFLIRESTPKYPSRAWIEWRETVLDIYDQKQPPGIIDAEINTGKIQSKTIEGWDELGLMLKEANESAEILSLIILYKLIVENSASYTPDGQIDKAIGQLVEESGIDQELFSEAEQQAFSWFEQKKEELFYTIIRVPASLKVILLDFSLRLLCYIIFQKVIWAREAGDSTLFFYLILQIIIIPVIILIYAVKRDRRIVLQTDQLVKKIDLNNIKVRIRNSAWHYFLLFSLVFSSWVIISNSSIVEFRWWLPITAVFIYAIYLLIIQNKFSKSLSTYTDIKKQLTDKEHRELSKNLSPEENDEEIVNLEVNLKAENERMNAYVIEAALFGALAFSGYLQLVSESGLSIENIKEFNYHISRVLGHFIDKDVKTISLSFSYLLGKNGIVSLLSYQLLLCSIFFLAVIASRLRFSKLTDYIDRFVQLSKAYNQKEEALLHSNNQDPAQLEDYNRKIRENLKSGYKKQQELGPIMEYMQFFRTMGIVMFFIIIITGGLFISPWISAILFFIAVLSMIYFYFGHLRSHFQVYYIKLQEFYYQSNKKIHWLCWGMIIIGLFLKSFYFNLGEPLVITGFLLLTIHYVLNLVVPIRFDYAITKADDVFDAKNEYYRFLEYLFKIGLALLFLGYLTRAEHQPGAIVFLSVSTFMLGAYFLLAPKFRDKKSLAGTIVGLAIFASLQAMLFKSSYWPASGVIGMVSIGLNVAAILIIIVKRTTIRPVVARAVVILTFLSAAFYIPFGRNAINNLSFSYEAYEKKIVNNKWESQFSAEQINKMNNHVISPDSVNSLVYTFNSEYLTSPYLSYELVNGISWSIFLYANDSLLNEEAMKWSHLTVQKDSTNWYWLDTYASLLYKNQRYDEALVYANKAYQIGKGDHTYELIQKIEERSGDFE